MAARRRPAGGPDRAEAPSQRGVRVLLVLGLRARRHESDSEAAGPLARAAAPRRPAASWQQGQAAQNRGPVPKLGRSKSLSKMLNIVENERFTFEIDSELQVY